MKSLIYVLLILVGLAYPFAVYFGFEYIAPEYFAFVLASLWLAKYCYDKNQQSLWVLLAVLFFCATLVVFRQSSLLHWYPVLINAMFLMIFSFSLYRGMPVIERLARLQQKQLPQHAVRYTRKVTQAWCVFFFCNGSIAAVLTLFAPQSWWLLYNGFIAYLLIGLMFSVEWLVRQRVKNAHELD